MKRSTISIILLLTLLLTSCGGGKTKPADVTGEPTAAASEEETTSAPLTDGLEDRDMEGFALSILHHNNEHMTWTFIQLDAESQNGELVNDAIFIRNAEIKERFNCNINIAAEKSINAQLVQKLVMAGDTTYDIIMQRDFEIPSSVQYLLNWYDIPYINFDADWWYPEATDVFRFGTKLTAAANSISLSCV